MKIVYESGNYDVRKNSKGHFEVYRLAPSGTHSVRCAYIGFMGDKGFLRATQEVDRRRQKDGDEPIIRAGLPLKA